MAGFLKDNRNKLWSRLEAEIQLKGYKKDKSFVLSGKWKKFVRNENNLKIFLVDGKWLRNNLCIYFSHGGHGFIHEFIPIGEIWIDSHHYEEGKSSFSRCECKVKKKGQRITKRFFESTVLHEITEYNEMKKGKSYFRAHQIALDAERKLGLLKDPFDDT